MQGMRGKLMRDRNSQTAGFIQKQDADDDNDKNDPPFPMLIMMKAESKKAQLRLRRVKRDEAKVDVRDTFTRLNDAREKRTLVRINILTCNSPTSRRITRPAAER